MRRAQQQGISDEKHPEQTSNFDEGTSTTSLVVLFSLAGPEVSKKKTAAGIGTASL